MINLFKGQKVDLTKGRPGMTKILVGLGWDTKKYDGGYDFDLDASAFLLGDNGKVPADSDFVFYGHLDHESGAVQHMGDNLKGKLPGSDANDCEQIKIDLAAIPANIAKIAITVTIYEAEERHQNFGQVSHAYVHIYDETNERELIRYDLGEDFSVETAVIVGEIYRSDVEWKFNAIGAGFQGGLRGLCLNLGVNV